MNMKYPGFNFFILDLNVVHSSFITVLCSNTMRDRCYGDLNSDKYYYFVVNKIKID